MKNELNRILRDIWLNWLVSSIFIPSQLRWRLMRMYGTNVQKSYISARCFFGGKNVDIGTGTFINYGCFFDTQAFIQIGSNVRIGMRCLFITGSHEIGGASLRAGAPTAAGISIGDGVWIGANSTVLAGVTIGIGSVVAAGSTVTRDVPSNTLVAGTPARVLRQLGTAQEEQLRASGSVQSSPPQNFE